MSVLGDNESFPCSGRYFPCIASDSHMQFNDFSVWTWEPCTLVVGTLGFLGCSYCCCIFLLGKCFRFQTKRRKWKRTLFWCLNRFHLFFGFHPFVLGCHKSKQAPVLKEGTRASPKTRATSKQKAASKPRLPRLACFKAKRFGVSLFQRKQRTSSITRASSKQKAASKPRLPRLTCFQARRVGASRFRDPKLNYRKHVQNIIYARRFYWMLGKGFTPLKSPKRVVALTRKALKNKVGVAVQTRPNTLKPGNHERQRFSPGAFFHGGAGGSSATARRRQEKMLLEGLKELLLQTSLLTEDTKKETTDGKARGRSPRKSRSPSPRSRSPSPAWYTVRPKKRGKGKGYPEPEHPKSILKPQTDSRQVTFHEDNNLLESLKSLILKFEQGKQLDLLSGLAALVNKFSSIPDPPRGPPKKQPPAPAYLPGPQPRLAALAKGNGKQGGKTASTAKPKNFTFRIDTGWWKTAHTSTRQLYDKLDQGDEPNGTVACVSEEDCEQLRALAQAQEVKTKVALIVTDTHPEAPVDSKGVVKWCRLSGGHWKQFVVFPLADELPKWPEEPHIAEVTEAPAKVDLISFRVVFCKEFLTPADWNIGLKKPVDLLIKSLPEGCSVRSYGWHHNPNPKEESVIGYFKVPEKDADGFSSRSGWKFGFYQKLSEKPDGSDREPIKWIPRSDLSPSAYVAQVRTMATKQKVGIILRRGGRNNLGLLGVQDDQDLNNLRRRWTVKGVPNDWGPSEFQEVMNKQGFRTFGDVQPPSHRGGVWTFTAVWPGTGHASCKILSIGSERPIVISPWKPPAAKRPHTEPLFGTRGWISRAAESNPAEISVRSSVATKVADTQLDPPSSQPVTNTEQAMEVDHVEKRSSEGKGQASPVKKMQKTQHQIASKLHHNDPSLGPDQVPMWDLGGDGDCGFRAVAAYQATRNQKPRPEILAKIKNLSWGLRTKVNLWLQKHDDWHEAWFQDGEASVFTEDGEVPTDIKSYLVASKRPKKWFDSFSCHAACNVIQSDIIVFKFVQGQWVFLQKFVPTVRKSKDPLPLFLKNGHICTLDPNVPIPHHWLTIDPKDFGPALSFLGGGKACLGPGPKSKATTIRKTKSDRSVCSGISSWLKPISQSNQSKKRPSAATSSVGSSWLKPVSGKSTTQIPNSGRPSIVSKTPGRASSPGPQTEQTRETFQWVCHLCDCRFYASSSRKLGYKRNKHISSRHKNMSRKEFTTIRTIHDIIPPLPLDRLPTEPSWVCSWCQQGIPFLPEAQRVSSAKAHLKICKDAPRKADMRKNLLNQLALGGLKVATKKAGVTLGKYWLKHSQRKAAAAELCKTLGHTPIKWQPANRVLYTCDSCTLIWRTETAMKTAKACKGKAARKFLLRSSARRLWYSKLTQCSKNHINKLWALNKDERGWLTEVRTPS